MILKEIEAAIRSHSRDHNLQSLNKWLTEETLSRFRDWVPAPSTGQTKLLDIGCYEPSIGYYVALGWKSIIGVAKEVGECSRCESYTVAGHDVQLFIADLEATAIPIPDASVDTVLMMEIVEHFGLDPMRAMAEANRVLKPKGTLVMSTPNASSKLSSVRLIRGQNPYIGLEFSGFSTNRHNRLYDCTELRQLLNDSGFEVQTLSSQTYMRVQLTPRERLFAATQSMFDALNRLLGSAQIERGEHIFAVAKKVDQVRRRFPLWLYHSPDDWPDWFEQIQRKSAAT